ncbi:MAG: lipopolysaccharide biosynthesis protein [Flavobacteriales bacterium]
MRKTFITNFLLLIVLNLAVKGAWVLGIDLQVQNTLGAEEYGLYYALLNISFLLNMLLDAGITNFNTFNIAQNRQLAAKHFSRIFTLKMAMGTLYLICTIVLAAVAGYNYYQLGLLLVLCLNQFLNSFILYLRSNLSGLQLFMPYTLTSVLDRAIMIAIVGTLLWSGTTNGDFKIEWFIYSQTFAYSISAITSFIIVCKHATPFRPVFRAGFSLAILKKSMPYAVLIILMMTYNRADGVLLERLLADGKTQAGIYAQSFRLMDAANMIAFLAAGLLFPLFSKMLKDRINVDQLLNLSFRIMVLPAIVGAAAVFFYRADIMELLYTEHAGESTRIVGWLMGCFVAITISYIFGTLLTANGNLRQLNIMAGGVAILNIALNVVAIPAMQARGAGIVAFASQWTAAILQVMIVQYFFRFKPNYKLIIKSAIFIACIGFIGHFTRSLHHTWTVNITIMIAACFIVGLSLGLLKIREIFQLIPNTLKDGPLRKN